MRSISDPRIPTFHPSPTNYQLFLYPQPSLLPQEVQSIPYAVPVQVFEMESRDELDYSRPQAWRNMPQQQQRGHNATGHSQQSNTELSFTHHSPMFSEVAMAANASVASSTVVPSMNCLNETSSVSSTASSATRGSVDAAVETMWDARRAREKAEKEADDKLVEAVCKASLVEFNERERALKAYECETFQRSQEHQTSSAVLQQAKSEAEQRKRAAMQKVIESKSRAKLMSEKAREATSLYEQKNKERLAKLAELEACKLREAQEAQLLVVQQRKEEAMRKRMEAEEKAREAREKADAIRHQAFEAASKMRANSRLQIETKLSHEEAQRQREMLRKLDEIEKNKELAHQRKEAAAKKAEEARRRAEELRMKAEQARAGLKSPTQPASTTS